MLWDRTMPADQHGFKPQKINLYLRFICDAFGWNSLLFAEEFVWVCRTWSLLIYFILKALVSGSFRMWFSRISMCLSFCFFFHNLWNPGEILDFVSLDLPIFLLDSFDIFFFFFFIPSNSLSLTPFHPLWLIMYVKNLPCPSFNL